MYVSTPKHPHETAIHIHLCSQCFCTVFLHLTLYSLYSVIESLQRRNHEEIREEARNPQAGVSSSGGEREKEKGRRSGLSIHRMLLTCMYVCTYVRRIELTEKLSVLGNISYILPTKG